MVALPFVKMEGAGNDYVFVDAHTHPVGADRAAELAVCLSDRHRGVGGDGLILLAPSDRADCRMLMWNADGSRGAMCGNGIRCAALLAHELGYAGASMVIESDAGLHPIDLVFDGAGQVVAARVDMGEVAVDDGPETLEACGETWSFHRGTAGNPHAVVFCDRSPAEVEVERVGGAFQKSPLFPDGVNVEFVRVRGTSLEQRTYERGSGETLACGTGATVAALAAMATGRIDRSEVVVRLRGGDLKIVRSDSRLVMEGPARTVFRGEIAVADELA